MLMFIRSFIRNIPYFLVLIITNSTPEGSILGIYIRKRVKKLDIRQILGIQLAGAAFFAGIILPQSHDALSAMSVNSNTPRNVIILAQSADLYQWPLTQFGISQNFSLFHPGMDLTDPIGTPIYPIADGVVSVVQFAPLGYGNHIMITHENGTQSLYAHLSVIHVSVNQRVTKSTMLGYVGTTGWSTGSHLHLEIYQDTVATNPLEVLPEIRFNPVIE